MAKVLKQRGHGATGQVGVVADDVLRALLAGPIRRQHVGRQGWCLPHLGGFCGQAVGAGLDGGFVPHRHLRHAAVQLQRAVRQADGVAGLVGDGVALEGEGAVAVFAVVAGEGEVAQRVQNLGLHLLPARAQLGLPGGRQRLVLRQDVLDGVFLGQHTFLAPVVLQPPQPEAAAAEVVQVALLDLALELVVGGKAAVGRQQQQGGLHALEVAVLLQRAAQAGEGLVHRVRRDRADGAAENVAFHQAHDAVQFVGAQALLAEVVVRVQQEGVGHIHLQFAQVVEGLLQVGVGLFAQGHGAVVGGEGVDVGHQVARVALVTRAAGPGVGLEGAVNLAHVRNLARLGGEVMPHEGVEVHGVGRLAEALFHRAPVVLVQLGLQLGLQAHQDEIADQVGLAQLTAGGVHALEDELRVVLVAVQRHIHDGQLGDAFADGQQLGLVLLDQVLEDLKVLDDARAGLGRRRRGLQDGQQRVAVGFGQQQLEVALAFLVGVEQVVVAQLAGREAFQRFAQIGLLDVVGQRRDEQDGRGQPLLAVDDQHGFLAGDRGQRTLDVDDGADEVGRHGVVAPGAQQVSPQLPAFVGQPRVVALVDRDDELRRLLQELQQVGFGGFHAGAPSLRFMSRFTRVCMSV